MKQPLVLTKTGCIIVLAAEYLKYASDCVDWAQATDKLTAWGEKTTSEHFTDKEKQSGTKVHWSQNL